MENSKLDLWREWKRLTNISVLDLEKFLKSPEGREAGLSRKEAKEQGIRSGRDSARALIRMKRSGRTYAYAKHFWTEKEWEWAKHQVAFIKRMSKAPGPLFKNGEKSRKYLSLLLWGHDPLAGEGKNLQENPSSQKRSLSDYAVMGGIGLAAFSLLRKKDKKPA